MSNVLFQGSLKKAGNLTWEAYLMRKIMYISLFTLVVAILFGSVTTASERGRRNTRIALAIGAIAAAIGGHERAAIALGGGALYFNHRYNEKRYENRERQRYYGSQYSQPRSENRYYRESRERNYYRHDYRPSYRHNSGSDYRYREYRYNERTYQNKGCDSGRYYHYRPCDR